MGRRRKTQPGRITYVGHATVLIELGGVKLLTDPVLRNRLGPLVRHGAPPRADLVESLDAVLISHLHRDHTDLPSLHRLSRTVPLFAPPGAGGFLGRQGFTAVTELAPGASVEVGDVTISAIEARHPGGRRLFSRAHEAVGFELVGRSRIYFAGDTDLFEGMAELGPGLDCALLPVWGWGPRLGPGHLTPERAAQAAAMLAPEIAVPIHWGTFFPAGLDHVLPAPLTSPPYLFARRAKSLAPQVEVRVLAPGEATSIS